MSRTNLRTLCFYITFTFIYIFGKSQDVSPCEVELMVRNGRTLKTAPQLPVTVRCPVQHCGESVNVTWCKLLNTTECEPIHFTGNSEIRQSDKRDEKKLISYLTFTRISIHDNGLYRCTFKAYKYELISHAINISVSDSNQGVNISDYDADEPHSPADDEDEPSVPYFYICFTITVLLFTLTALWFLSFCGWKPFVISLTPVILTEGQAMQSTHVVPDLPVESAPSTRAPCYTGSQSAAERPLPPPPPTGPGNMPDRSQVADRVVYAVVNHRQSAEN
ncbi:B- and T-lymphocyte attenuator [Pungitius pungitius]|uniref:B- and T-lymphocyte attenuator n=1 Tax=Pungitius pungitius TaxID=134920 RepID=UPI002E11AB28